MKLKQKELPQQSASVVQNPPLWTQHVLVKSESHTTLPDGCGQHSPFVEHDFPSGAQQMFTSCSPMNAGMQLAPEATSQQASDVGQI